MILSGSVIGGSSVACDSAISVAALSTSATAPASAPPAIAARKVGYRFAEPAPQIHDPVTDNRAVGAVSRSRKADQFHDAPSRDDERGVYGISLNAGDPPGVDH